MKRFFLRQVMTRNLQRTKESAAFRSTFLQGFGSTAYNKEESTVQKKVALVLGSSGCLGSAVSRYLSQTRGMKVIGADIDASTDGSSAASHFIHLKTYDQPTSLADVTMSLVEGVANNLEEEEEIDAIICANGGWIGDPKLPKPDANEEDFRVGIEEYGNTIQSMMEMNLYPVLAAGYAANRFMADEGLFVAIGATPALSATPGMLAYGLSKVGTHHFVQTLGETTGKAMTTRSRRQKARRLRQDSQYLDSLSVLGILPTTIDTPTNRKSMPGAIFDEWTKPIDIAKQIGDWVDIPALRPHSGSLLKVYPMKGGGAMFSIVQ